MPTSVATRGSRYVMGLFIACALIACAGERRVERQAAALGAPAVAVPPAAAARPARAPLLTRCQTDPEACRDLASADLDAPASKTRCDRGDREGCLLLGLTYTRGARSTTRDALAKEAFARACQLDHAAACALAVGLPGDDDLHSRETAEHAIPFLARACEGEVVSACETLGSLYYLGEFVDAEPQLAATYLRRACQLRSPDACFDVAPVLRYMDDLHNGVRPATPGPLHTQLCQLFDTSCRVSHEYSCVLLERHCERENPVAYENHRVGDHSSRLCRVLQFGECAKAGKLREGAPGVAPSMIEADKLYQFGCLIGESESCLGRAALLMHGRLPGPIPGDPKAILDDACDRELTGACLGQGLAYQRGELGRRDPGAARELFARACALREPRGCLELARSLRDPLAGPADPERLREALRSACALGSLEGCREGAAHEPSARDWFDAQACTHGEASACDRKKGALQIAAKPVLEDTCLMKGCLLRFVGAAGRTLMIAAGAEHFLVDPERVAVTEHAATWYVDQLISRPGRLGPQKIWTAAWGWDAAAGGLAALLGIGGEGRGAIQSMVLWSARGPAPLQIPRPRSSRAISVEAMSPDLRYGVVTLHGEKKRAVVMDLRARRELGDIIEGTLGAVAFSSDSRQVALGFADGSVTVMSTATGAAIRFQDAVSTLKGPLWGVASLSFHPTRPWLIATDLASRARLWKLDGPDPISIPLFPAESSLFAAFSADGRTLALADQRQLVLLDAATLLRLAPPAPCPRCVDATSLAISADSSFAAILDRSSAVSLFSITAPAAASANPEASSAN